MGSAETGRISPSDSILDASVRVSGVAVASGDVPCIPKSIESQWWRFINPLCCRCILCSFIIFLCTGC